MTAIIRINRVHFPVTVLGPGKRVGIWVQGCTIGCAGCVSLDTWDSDGGIAVTVDGLVKVVDQAIRDGCSGVTISGGEPFDQAPALEVLASELRLVGQRHSVDLDVLCFSGYSLAKLRRVHPRVLGLLDGVIAGPFVESRPTDLTLRGSANQELVALSDLGEVRYGGFVDHRDTQPAFQVAVETESVTMIGIPRRGDLTRLSELARRRGVHLDAVSWSS